MRLPASYFVQHAARPVKNANSVGQCWTDAPGTAAEAQWLQFLLSEATWDAEAITVRRLSLLAQSLESALSASGMLVLTIWAIARMARYL
jgi:hypothetical protein